MPILKNCCFCVSLKNGGVILGGLSLIGSFIGTVAIGLLLSAVLRLHKEGNDEGYELWPLLVVLLGSFIILIITSGMLIFGTVKVMTISTLTYGSKLLINSFPFGSVAKTF